MRSKLVRQARAELRDRRYRNLVRLAIHSLSARMRRRIVIISRYARWAVMSLTSPDHFVFRGDRYRYFRHPHNATWENERAVEIPVIRRVLENADTTRVLEVGNVLRRYIAHDHEVVDKYEGGRNVLNVDIVDFSPEHRYDLIVSVSTLEHVGWDEEKPDPGKTVRAVERLRSLLAPGGQAILTLPLGYNPHLDGLLSDGLLGLDRVYYLMRVDRAKWREASAAEARDAVYGSPYPGANSVAIGVLEASATTQ